MKIYLNHQKKKQNEKYFNFTRNSDRIFNTKFNGSIGYEGVLSGDSEALMGKIENNTAQAFTSAAQDTANQGVLVSLGLSNKFGAGYMISAQYNGNFGDGSSQNHRAVVSLVKAF